MVITSSAVLSSVLQSQGVALVTTSGPLALVGIYYGFLTVLPFGLSQIVCLRACLLEEEDKRPPHWHTIKLFGTNVPDALLWSLGGLMVAQLALFVSAYCPPFYAMWISPHALSMLLIPYALFYAYRILTFERLFRPDTRMWQEHLRSVFIDSAVFQWLNPVLLPSPVLARIMSLFMFRYSQMPLFLLGGLVGWLLGHATLALLCYLLFLRLQSSLRLSQIPLRLIHELFAPLVLALCLALLNRAPVLYLPLPPKIKQWQYSLFSLDKNSPYYDVERMGREETLQREPWPSEQFIVSGWKRPVRALRDHLVKSSEKAIEPTIENIPIFSRNVEEFPFLKRHFSQHFFAAVISDGNLRLSHTYPKGLMLLRNLLKAFAGIPARTMPEPDEYWEEDYAQQLNESVSDRVKALDQGAEVGQVLAKRLCSWTETGQSVQKWKDPRLAQSLCGRYIFGTWQHPNLVDAVIIGGSRWNLIESDNRAITKMVEMAESLPSLPKGVFSDLIFNSDPFLFKRFSVLQSGVTAAFKPLPVFSLKNVREFEFKLRTIPTKIQNKGSLSFRRDIFRMRNRLRKAVLWNVFERRLQAPFWLRIRRPESTENALKTKQWAGPVLQPRESLRRKRQHAYNNLFVHILRSPSLFLQLYLRRYVRQPLFIVLKSLARWILSQPSEWDQDWFEWKQEIIYYCNYAKDFKGLTTARPPKWWFYGLQIKIVSPFHIRPWHRSTREVTKGQQEVFSSFLDVIGHERVLPFGNVRKLPYFWRPVRGALSLRFQQFSSSPSGQPIISWYLSLQRFLTKRARMGEVGTTQTLPPEVAANQPQASRRSTQQLTAEASQQTLEQERRYKIVQEQLIETKSLETRQRLREFDSWLSQLQSSADGKIGSRSNKKPLVLQKSHLMATKSIWEQRQRAEALFQPSHLRIQPLSNESSKSIQYRANQLQEALLQIRRHQSLVIRQLAKQWNILSSGIKPQKQPFSLSGYQSMRLPVHSVEWQALHVDWSLNHLWRTLWKSNQDAFAPQEESKRALSQAYLLHKVWEANTADQPQVALSSKPGISEVLDLSDLQAFGVTAWQEWLDSLYHHMPSRRVWQSFAPQQWALKRPLSSHQITDETESLQPLQAPPLLELLFIEAKNASVRSKGVALSRGYTEPLPRKAPWSKQDGLLLIQPISKLGAASSGRSTLAALSKLEDRAELTIPISGLPESPPLPKQLNKIRCDYYIPNDVSYQLRFDQKMFVSNMNMETLQELSDLKLLVELKRKRRINKAKTPKRSKPSFFYTARYKGRMMSYTEREEGLEANLLHDARLLQNMAGIWLEWLQTQPTSTMAANPKNLSSIAKRAQTPFWQMTPFTPEEMLLPSQIRALRVLNGFIAATDEASRQSPSHSAQLKIDLSQQMNESHEMTRFLWSSYRFEDLACMNRAWIGTANQSRFSALRLRMYPPIPTT